MLKTNFLKIINKLKNILLKIKKCKEK